MRDLRGIGMTSQRTRARMVQRLREKGIRDERVLGAMARVPRHLFVEEALASRAYEDTALPIGFSQTISQPFVVARMIELVLGKEAGKEAGNGQTGRVLEVGTGCGYQAAVLAEIFPEAYSVERIKALHERARANLLALRLKNLRLVHGDGYAGLDSAAPFQAIVVAAASRELPRTLLRQLALGGRMILPLHEGTGQRLMLYERGTRGFVESELDPVRFVPMEMGKA
ncbi:MAG TPA: protein-L-isoaspartate(D-aspartate) O-methyltransferase [Burkholderiales bacterium]|jgi:protein-L-isoaspartate(D-aspartate) O-methyltransferase|nr:protein-L-isoaspartate(D-aspartate) O-methyltransferase [Burkholderiales bacterium]